MHQRTFVLAQHHPFQGAWLDDREHLDRLLLIPAQRKGGGIQHLQILRDRLIEVH